MSQSPYVRVNTSFSVNLTNGGGNGDVLLLSEAFEAFEVDHLLGLSQSRIDSHRGALNSFLRANGDDVDIALLSYLHIIVWKREMYACDNKSSYIAAQLLNLRAVLTYLKNHGFQTLNPSEITIPTVEYRKTGWLTIPEMQRFLRAIDRGAEKSLRARDSYIRDKALFAMQFSAGARISELLSLNLDQAEKILTEKNIKVRGKGKTNTDDPLCFDQNSLSCLRFYLEHRQDSYEPLFLSRDHRRLHITTAIQSFHKYCKMARIEMKGVGATHQVRHSHITDLRANGATLETTRDLARHKRADTTKVYDHSEDPNRLENYQKFHTPTPI